MPARRTVILAAIGLLAAGGGAIRLLPGSERKGGIAAPPPDGHSGALDGRVYSGIFRSHDGEISLNDSLHFQGGHFWSAGCIECSFPPGTYWTRRVGAGGLAFRGKLESPRRGRFTYEGRVAGEEIEVAVHWRRARWYWTIERDFLFTGRADRPADGRVGLDAAWQRARGQPAPDCAL